MKLAQSFILITIASLFFTTCKKEESVIPPADITPTHPTITWTADTIKNPYVGVQLLLESIWGSDTNDVYAVGHNAEGGSASMFHFNGQKWSSIKITKGEGGFIGSYVSFSEIDGSGKNDVWAVGSRGGYFGSNLDSSLVIHFDGTGWSEVSMSRCKFAIQRLKVLSSTNIYMTGSAGEVYHYDGLDFTKYVLDTNLVLTLGGDANNMFVGGRSFLLFPNEYISVYSMQKGNPWKRIKKITEVDYYKKNDFGFYDFYPRGDGKYFAVGNGVFTVSDSLWQIKYQKDTYQYIRLRGTAPSNIFALTQLNKIIHWNGVDWKQINNPPNVNSTQYLMGLWVKGNSIFVSATYTEGINIIYRGTY